MDPSQGELAAMVAAANPLNALVNFVGLSSALVTTLREELGDFQRLRELVAMPLSDWTKGLEAAQMVTKEAVPAEGDRAEEPAVRRTLNALEKGQAGLLRRYARLLVGLPLEAAALGPSSGAVAGGGAPGGQTESAGRAGSATGVGAFTPGRKVKLSSKVDQADDAEVSRPWTPQP